MFYVECFIRNIFPIFGKFLAKPMVGESLKDRTAKGLFWGGLSNGLQQLLNLFFGIFLARLLSPSDYGMVGILNVFGILAVTLQECGFSSALVNKAVVRQEDYNAVFWFNVLVGFILYWILFFSAPLIARFFDTPELTALSRYLFLAVLISCMGTAHYAYLFRNMRVKQNSIILLISLVISGTAGVIMAYYGLAYWGMATQAIINSTCLTVLRWFFSGWRPSFRLDFRPLKEMLSYSYKILITNIFLQFNNNLLSIVMGRFYTIKDVGFFTQSNKWNNMGCSVIQGMVQSVAQPVLHNVDADKERLRRVFRKLLRFVSFVSFPCLLGLSLVASELITISITNKWSESIVFLQLLCISGAFVPIHNLYSNLVLSRGRSDIYMWTTLVLLSVQILVSVLVHGYGMKIMVICYVLVYIIWTFVWHYWAWRLIKLSLWDAIKDVFPFLFVSSVVVFLSDFICLHVTDNMYASFIGKILFAGLLYIGVMWLLRVKTLQEAFEYLFKKKSTSNGIER